MLIVWSLATLSWDTIGPRYNTSFPHFLGFNLRPTFAATGKHSQVLEVLQKSTSYYNDIIQIRGTVPPEVDQH